MTKQNNQFDHGIDVIRKTSKSLNGEVPGVYRMLDDQNRVLYVGKAKSLKKRILSYTHINKLPMRLKRMVAETKKMELIQTESEVQALLLESNLIKTLEPRYNVLFKDDKSFPYIALSADHDYPSLFKYRGSKKKKWTFFGPYPSAGSVRRTLIALQKAFLIRNCSDSNFASRTRPCLQYHIKRCTAPCVNYVSKEAYKKQITEAIHCLEGKSSVIREHFKTEMQRASENREYELAARYRDRLRAINVIEASQSINTKNVKDADIIAIAQREGISCIQVFIIRSGQNLGNQSFFPKHDKDIGMRQILSAFVTQFYSNRVFPRLILVNDRLEDHELIENALSESANAITKIIKPSRGERKELINMAEHNAQEALKRHLMSKKNDKEHLEAVAKLFDLDEIPDRIEIYDNSHISGKDMVGALVVAGPEGFIKNGYRRFNIKKAGEADDYGMMREVIERRFKRLIHDQNEYQGDKGDYRNPQEGWPDLILIDGGKGQLSSVLETLETLNIKDDVNVVAISKGEDRNAGREVFHQEGKSPFQLPEGDADLHYLQRLRDEAHRFAITTQRAKRQKTGLRSELDTIEGVGPSRKRALLKHFGSVKEIIRASQKDIERVPGISSDTAEKIYGFFHGG